MIWNTQVPDDDNCIQPQGCHPQILGILSPLDLGNSLASRVTRWVWNIYYRWNAGMYSDTVLWLCCNLLLNLQTLISVPLSSSWRREMTAVQNCSRYLFARWVCKSSTPTHWHFLTSTVASNNWTISWTGRNFLLFWYGEWALAVFSVCNSSEWSYWQPSHQNPRVICIDEWVHILVKTNEEYMMSHSYEIIKTTH